VTIDLDKPGMAFIVSAVVWIALVGAGGLLFLAWRVSHNGAVGRIPLLGLALLSISYLWLLGVLFLPTRVAPDYSDLRYTTIDINTAIVVLSIIFSVARVRAGVRVLVAAIPVLFLWLYVGVVSVAV
jgi:hypothetical protein